MKFICLNYEQNKYDKNFAFRFEFSDSLNFCQSGSWSRLENLIVNLNMAKQDFERQIPVWHL